MNITLTREEAHQILDAFAWELGGEPLGSEIDKAIETLRARLSAPQPEYRDVVIAGDLWRIEFLPDHAASVVLVRANYEAQPEPERPLEIGDMEQRAFDQECGFLSAAQPEPEPVAWMYEYGTDHGDAVNQIFWHKNLRLEKPDGMVRNVVPLYTAPPKRDFKFSTIEEAKQPMPTPVGKPQLTDDESRFADAFTTLLKAGYGKEAEIVLKCKPRWQGLTDEEMSEAMDYWSDPKRSAYGGAHSADGEYVGMVDTWRYIEAKLKEKNASHL